MLLNYIEREARKVKLSSHKKSWSPQGIKKTTEDDPKQDLLNEKQEIINQKAQVII